jgi:hypothetical protein
MMCKSTVKVTVHGLACTTCMYHHLKIMTGLKVATVIIKEKTAIFPIDGGQGRCIIVSIVSVLHKGRTLALGLHHPLHRPSLPRCTVPRIHRTTHMFGRKQILI